MGNTSSTHRITAQDRAILDMKIQRDKLHQYQKKITVITRRETDVARQCLRNGQKEKALLALRRKKYQESLLAKTDQQLAQLEILTGDVEFALVQKDVLYGLQQGTAVLKAIHKEMGGIDKVELILSESEEARAYQEEISDMLQGQMSNDEEDMVEDELEALEREVRGVTEAKSQDTNVSRLVDQSLSPPTHIGDELPAAPQETPEQRARRLRREQSTKQAAQPLPA